MKKELSLQDIHDIQLDMLIQFDRFAKQNNLTYFLAYGTLLGAVRHNGFIPWDDDVDIWMPRADYEKLLNYDNVSQQYKIVSRKNPNGYYHPFSYANIADTQTVMHEKMITNPTGKGVYLDIFPLDQLPDNKKNALSVVKKSRNYTRMECIALNQTEKGIKGLIKSILKRFINIENVNEKIEAMALKCDKKKSRYIGNVSFLVFPPQRAVLYKEDFEKSECCDFEGVFFPIPCGYKRILTTIYGDYMTPPPEAERKGHHDINVYRIEK